MYCFLLAVNRVYLIKKFNLSNLIAFKKQIINNYFMVIL